MTLQPIPEGTYVDLDCYERHDGVIRITRGPDVPLEERYIVLSAEKVQELASSVNQEPRT
jgi:hypothetical protein